MEKDNNKLKLPGVLEYRKAIKYLKQGRTYKQSIKLIREDATKNQSRQSKRV